MSLLKAGCLTPRYNRKDAFGRVLFRVFIDNNLQGQAWERLYLDYSLQYIFGKVSGQRASLICKQTWSISTQL